jgi:serine/threonine protein kinase/tetratricopeptide (TPR) repeat protein
MNPPARTADGDLPVGDWRRIDAACDRFEAAWRAGGRPDPTPYLAEVSGPARERLLRELLAIELESRRGRGERPDATEFAARFPGEVRVVDSVFTDLGPGGPRDTLASRREGGGGGDSPGRTHATAVGHAADIAPVEIGPAALEALRAAGYEVTGELGRGGMGVVYLARNLALDRPCALKMILAGAHAGRHAAARFRVEAAAVARLKHPGIVQIHHVGEADGLPFLELEYLAGGSLATEMDGRPRSPHASACLIEALARAIAEAHRLGIVHRDLKPANILLDGGGQPKVADFGLAKILDSEDGLTRTNLVIGSPSYMAPEQAEGQASSVGMAVDTYALGAILYELLTGRPPFRAATTLETLEQVKTIEPVPPSRLQPGLPRDLETICLKCLAKAPVRRYATAEALAEDLRRHLAGEPIEARPSPFWERGWKWARRRPAVAAAIAIAATAVAAMLGGAFHYNARLRDSNARLQQAVADARAAELRAQANARVADTQRDLALKAFLELANGVQAKLRDSPATLGLRGSLLDTAIAGLGEIARTTEESAPDLDRAVAQRKLADVYRQLGRYPEARHQLELSMKLANDLTARSPDDPEILECLGVVDYQLAWVELSAGHFQEGQDLSRRGVEACEAALAIDPTRPLAREYRVRNNLQLGHSFLWKGMLPEGLAALGTTIDLARRWAADEPESVTAREVILATEVKLGDASDAARDWPASRAHYLEAIAIGRQLIADVPDRTRYRGTLAGTLINFVDSILKVGRAAEAEPFIQEAERLAAGLAEADPDHVDYQILLAEAQAHAAGVAGAEARFIEAAGRLRPALERLRRLKREGRLEGLPVYGVEFIKSWAQDLAYFEGAARALDDLAFARSGPPGMASRLLRLRARTLSRRGDWPGFAATAEAACDLAANDLEAFKELASTCAACAEAIDAFPPGGSAEERVALRRRCVERAVAALSRAIDLGWGDAQSLAESEDLKPIRPHSGFQALIERLRSPGTTR